MTNKTTRPITESQQSKVLQNVIRRTVEAADAIPEHAVKNMFQKIVRNDIIAAVQKINPGLKQIPEGHRIWANRDLGSGNFYVAFTYGKDDKRSNQDRVAEIGYGLRREFGFKKINDPYPRKATKDHAIKQGGVYITTPVWCQDLIQPLNTEYPGAADSLGYGFDVQINAAKTTLSIEVRFTGKAL